MRGEDVLPDRLFSYANLEARIPLAHPPRKRRRRVNGLPAAMSDEFAARYSHTGRPSVAPQKPRRASLLHVLYTIRGERQLVEQRDYNLPFRGFMELGVDDPVGDRPVFRANRDRSPPTTPSRPRSDRISMVPGVRGNPRGFFTTLLSDMNFRVPGSDEIEAQSLLGYSGKLSAQRRQSHEVAACTGG